MDNPGTKLRKLAFFAVTIAGPMGHFLNGAHASSAMDASSSLNGIQMGDSLAVSAASNDSLLWGIYRPNLYFGTRPRLPDTLMTGLMWFGLQDYAGPDNIRHECRESDKLDKYGWLKHDGRKFGIQQLKDSRNNIEITTEFIKIPGGVNGGSWGARVTGKPIRIDESMYVSTMYYIGLDGLGKLYAGEGLNTDAPVSVSGSASGLDDFEITIEKTKGFNMDAHINYVGLLASPGTVWKAKDYARDIVSQVAKLTHQSGKKDYLPEDLYRLPNQYLGGDPNLLILQMNFGSDFEFEVRFNSKSSPNPVTSDVMISALDKAEQAFDTKFEKTFNLAKLGYKKSMVDFAKATMSNLVGGIGYFHGSAIVDESETYDDGQFEHLEGPVARRPTPSPELTEPASLFSAVPSRSFFPRGFYWDEGFHQTLIGQWDNDLSLEIIESWFNRQDNEGWIQREQILGEESRSRVPTEFQVQYPEHANPPTLLTAISGYVQRLQNASNTFGVNVNGNSDQTTFGSENSQEPDVTNARLEPSLGQEYLARLYPKLRTNYYWMRKTMQGGIRQWGRMSRSRVEGYRWRGRTLSHTLTSGLDDYPRAERPHIAELHVDLLCWIGFASRNLQNIAAIVGEEDDAEEFEDHFSAIVKNVDDLHWSEEHKAYCDLTVDEDDASIQVCHKGYISLFPMMLGIVDSQSDKLGHILDMMYDPKELWSPFGLRSLSKSDKYFGTGENYWKGPIWINLNYLSLHSLKQNYFVPGPHQAMAKKVYNELRANIINNIYKEYERSGFVWEQYNDVTGHGQRSHPFTGWTAMVVQLMQMGPAE